MEKFPSSTPDQIFESEETKQESPELLPPCERIGHLNPDDYPILSKQNSKISAKSEERYEWGIDLSASEYVTDTANLIAIIDGTAESRKGEPKTEHVIYLDKSARPVSWLTNVFWDTFSKEKRPPHSYLAIDRADWFRKVGINSDKDGKDKEDRKTLLTFSDFNRNADRLDKRYLAGIRALYIEDGVDDSDPDKIMDTPASLDGKHILIVDEVKRSGSTLEIAKWLIEHAFKDTTVETAYFWKSDFQRIEERNADNEIVRQEDVMMDVPIWYDSESSHGRGIDDIDVKFFQDRYEEYPTKRNLAKKLGAFILGKPKNLVAEPGQKSRQLATEIKRLKRDYDAGKILLQAPIAGERDTDEYCDEMEKQGFVFEPNSKNPNSYTRIRDSLGKKIPQ